MKLLKKITIKAVFGDVKKAVASSELVQGDALPVMRVVGKCDRSAVKETDYGASVTLKGNFMATNLATGEIARSNTCYLPDAAADAVAGALLDAETVEFGFDIFAEVDAGSATGYVYSVTPLIAPKEDDALSRLAASLPAIPQLAAPESGEALAKAKPAKK